MSLFGVDLALVDRRGGTEGRMLCAAGGGVVELLEVLVGVDGVVLLVVLVDGCWCVGVVVVGARRSFPRRARP